MAERAIFDTDWHVHRLYDFARDLGATLIRTDIARAVIDMNRDPSGASLYPGQATTELCPTTTFDGEPLHHPGMAPDDAEIAARRERFHTPYHAALTAEIARLRALHPAIVLYDAHSIRSRVPRLFEGELPEFNIGSVGRTSCAPALVDRVEALCPASGRSLVVDGRFRGGWTTRHHGQPGAGRPRHPDGTRPARLLRRGRAQPLGPGARRPGHPDPHPDPLRLHHLRKGPRMSNRRDNQRIIRAPHGAERSCQSWQTEAALRMLMNNLDPAVAENPQELVVYGGIGRAARDWECFDQIVASLRLLKDDETLLIQSGKPVGVFRTHENAPRVLLANSNLVPKWATWEHFHALDKAGLMMYGQMTAGVVDLHRQPGHRPGHLRNLRRGRAPALWRQPRRPLDPHRRAWRHGRRAAAGRDHGGRLLPRRRMPAEPHRDAPEDRLSRQGHRQSRRSARLGDERQDAALGRPARQCRRRLSGARPPRRPPRCHHRPDLGA